MAMACAYRSEQFTVVGMDSLNVLVVGSGGREHALAWKLAQSPRCARLFIAPGNAGTARVGENVPIAVSDLEGLARFASENQIGLTVVGPDDALADGLVDVFAQHGLRAFGPTRAAARLESSKIFAKDFMERHGIPTARAERFEDSASAVASLERFDFPVVVKADGLALGKGVVIARSHGEAAGAIRDMIDGGRFGEAGRRVLVEEFLEGFECSIHALFDANSYLVFPPAQDHKAALDGGKGSNTGGMGTYSPIPFVDSSMMARIDREILRPFFEGARKDGLGFRGILFPGLMLTQDGPKVLEFNCRFGDPETQVLLPRMKSDLLGLLDAAVDDRLDTVKVEWDERAAVCVIMASGGYPGEYRKGLPVTGLDQALSRPAVEVFHAGTALDPNSPGGVVTSGGRVLGVTALAGSLVAAVDLAYSAVGDIAFEGAHFRTDIAAKGLLELSAR